MNLRFAELLVHSQHAQLVDRAGGMLMCQEAVAEFDFTDFVCNRSPPVCCGHCVVYFGGRLFTLRQEA